MYKATYPKNPTHSEMKHKETYAKVQEHQMT